MPSGTRSPLPLTLPIVLFTSFPFLLKNKTKKTSNNNNVRCSQNCQNEWKCTAGFNIFFNLDLLNFDCDPEFLIRKAASSLACAGSDAEGYRASPPAPIHCWGSRGWISVLTVLLCPLPLHIQKAFCVVQVAMFHMRGLRRKAPCRFLPSQRQNGGSGTSPMLGLGGLCCHY